MVAERGMKRRRAAVVRENILRLELAILREILERLEVKT